VLVGGAVVLAGVGWLALRGPRASSIELEPAGPVYLRAGTPVSAPLARALDAQGNVVSGLEVSCTSDTPAVRLREGLLASDGSSTATVRCTGGGAEGTYAVRSLAPYRSATIDYELVPIAPGKFRMGSPPTEEGRSSDEAQHKVELTRAYWLGTTEVTQSQWEKVMGSNPSSKETGSESGPVSLLDPSYPVQSVSWCDAVVFANKLSEKDELTPVYVLPGGLGAGLEYAACNELAPKVTMNAGADGYRLPTESEWEFAARGGTDDRWAGTDLESDLCGFANIDDQTAAARFGWGDGRPCDDHRAGLAPVGSYTPNAYGLKDMSGNVWEWTWDTYGDYPPGPVTDPTGATEGPDRVYRGGSWFGTAGGARAAYRFRYDPGYRYGSLGVRLSRTIP
jgi:formylglycine-generating enzyme required for sulfatase activity